MNEEDILRITDKLLLRRSFIFDLSDVGIFLCLPLSIISQWALVRILEIAALSEILTKLSTYMYEGLCPIL
jgi:hypothetical protein